MTHQDQEPVAVIAWPAPDYDLVQVMHLHADKTQDSFFLTIRQYGDRLREVFGLPPRFLDGPTPAGYTMEQLHRGHV